MGKGVDFSARAVITPDVNIRILKIRCIRIETLCCFQAAIDGESRTESVSRG